MSRFIYAGVLALLLQQSQPVPLASPEKPSTFTAAAYAIGFVSSPVTVVEYLSDTCSHCAAFNRDVYPQLVTEYIETGRLRLIIRELPTAPLVVSSAGFLFARCQGEHEYWKVVRRLLESQAYVLAGVDQQEQIDRAATVAGLTADEAHACLSDDSAIATLNDRRSAAFEAGADSTPTFLFNGRMLIGLKLAGAVYRGGELSFLQFVDAYNRCLKGDLEARRTGNHQSPLSKGQLRQAPPS